MNRALETCQTMESVHINVIGVPRDEKEKKAQKNYLKNQAVEKSQC